MTSPAELDKRPPPKPRKHAKLWQLYLMWRELNDLIKRHVERERSAERSKSNYSADVERDFLDNWLSIEVPYKNNPNKMRRVRYDDLLKEQMVDVAREAGPIFDWLISIRGIAEPSAAKLIAQIDDPAKFATVSKLWRHAGYGTYSYWFNGKGEPTAPRDGWKWYKVKKDMVIECPGCGRVMEPVKGGYACKPCEWKTTYGDKIKLWTVTEPKADWVLKEGVRDRLIEGWHSPWNATLKSELFVIADNFIKQRTPVYRQHYDRCKAKDKQDHPERIKVNGRWMYNDGHLHARARRKVIKLFLQHIYVTWREYEGLPISEPWILREGTGHTNYIEPPVVMVEDPELVAV